MNVQWNIKLTRATIKQIEKLNVGVLPTLHYLLEELTVKGPILLSWPNYGKLQGTKRKDKYHCHLKKGKPTYVCCWEVTHKKQKIIEVYYVGTHEKAPY